MYYYAMSGGDEGCVPKIDPYRSSSVLPFARWGNTWIVVSEICKAEVYWCNIYTRIGGCQICMAEVLSVRYVWLKFWL